MERALDETQQTPSLSQAQRIKQESKEGTADEDTVHKIISEEKKPLYNSVTLSHDTLKKYFPKSYIGQTNGEYHHQTAGQLAEETPAVPGTIGARRL